MLKRIYLLLFICMSAMPLFAQLTDEEKARVGAGEINRQQEFFDPTRKEKKEKEVYHFSVDYRFEVGYQQNQQRSDSWCNPFLHGVKLAFTADFNLPYHFSIQTGLGAGITYGQIEQHWRSQNAETVQEEYLRHGINQYYLEIPVRAYYTQKLWQKLNMFFYAGPKMRVGLAELDFIREHLSDPTREWLIQEGVVISNHNRYPELYRSHVSFGLGGGLEWDRYRLVAGYDFGLNNMLRSADSYKMHEWGWYVSFAYKINQ